MNGSAILWLQLVILLETVLAAAAFYWVTVYRPRRATEFKRRANELLREFERISIMRKHAVEANEWKRDGKTLFMVAHFNREAATFNAKYEAFLAEVYRFNHPFTRRRSGRIR